MRFYFNKDFKEILSSEIISLTGSLFAGLLLAIAEKKIFLVPGIFVLIPGFLAMRGEISASFSSRIMEYLLEHRLKPDFRRAEHSKIVWQNLTASFILVLLIATLLGFFAFIITFMFFRIYYPAIILVSIIAGLIANMIEIPLTLSAIIWFYNKKIDPGNVMGPFVTTTGDITSILAILVTIMVML